MLRRAAESKAVKFMNRRKFILGGIAGMGLLSAGGYSFIHSEAFGHVPTGKRLARIQASPYYQDGQFQCLEPVADIMESSGDDGEGRIMATWKFLFGDKKGLVPEQPMLSRKTDLKSLSREEDIVIWMGHSTFYLQLAGRRILIDPVFSSYASPVFFVNRAFPGSNVYTAADFPAIDVLLLSHDHWDHLDYPSIMALQPKIREIVCPLGVGAYFEQWGFSLEHIHEEDWFTEVRLADDFRVYVLPSQHFSGRFLEQNKTQWAGFALVTPGKKVFCSGDGGYGGHFKRIGEQFGGFDLAIMENGQYNRQWPRIHLMPEETAQAAEDVQARTVIPAHSGKFALSRHTWDAPYRALAAASQGRSYTLLTPKIGEAAAIGGQEQSFAPWWENMR